MRPLRLFLALDLPDDLRARADRALAPLRRPDPRVRWLAPASFHLTLRFLGPVEASRVPSLVDGVSRAVRPHLPVALALQGGGALPGPSRPRALWLGVSGDLDGLVRLVGAVEQAAVELGFPPNGRRFVPHVTVARVRSGRPARLLEALSQLGPIGDFTARDVALVRSDVTHEGARYTTVARLPPPT